MYAIVNCSTYRRFRLSFFTPKALAVAPRLISSSSRPASRSTSSSSSNIGLYSAAKENRRSQLNEGIYEKENKRTDGMLCSLRVMRDGNERNHAQYLASASPKPSLLTSLPLNFSPPTASASRRATAAQYSPIILNQFNFLHHRAVTHWTERNIPPRFHLEEEWLAGLLEARFRMAFV